MSKPGLGTKRTCVGCAVRFYDLSRSPPTCPKCSAVQPPDVVRPRYGGRNPSPGSRGAPWHARPAAIAAETDDTPDTAPEDAEDDTPDDETETDVAEIEGDIELPTPTRE